MSEAVPRALDDSRSWLIGFARRLPGLLGRFGVTADIAARFDALRIEAQLDSLFTLAIVGRMKAGKSTLLNALIDQDLALVGVTETTATINWFDGLHAGDSGQFEIHWRDAGCEPECRPLARLGELAGHSREAANVGHLRFFAGASFLEKVRIVDTPGFGSTVRAHEKAIGEYLNSESSTSAARNEAESERLGGRADAVLLVIAVAAREGDTKALDDFQRRTRFPGQGPYNSIAVLQKWETFPGNPVEEARRIAANIKTRMQGRVADVLPISGMLHQVSKLVSNEAMEELVRLGHEHSAAQLEAMTQSEDTFRAEPTRAALYHSILMQMCGNGRPDQVELWPIMRFLLRLIPREKLVAGVALRGRIRELGGVDHLRAELQRRFFKLSALIRSGSVSTRALDLCEQAQHLLKREQARLSDMERLDAALRGQLKALGAIDPALQAAVLASIERNRSLIGDARRALEATAEELDEWVRSGQRQFQLLLADTAHIESLDGRDIGFEDEIAEKLRTLFGLRGIEPWQRLGLSEGATSATFRQRADELLAEVSVHLDTAAKIEQRRVLAHAVQRLQAVHRVLDELG